MTAELGRLSRALADRYRVERELGAGGMATVYLAEDLKHHRRVAIKVLHPELAAVLGAERFLAEIRTTANLQHPHILPLFDSGAADGLVFYVMPYVEGETLRERLVREQQLPIEEAVRIAQGVANALDYAHRHGVIHRDIKPENILLQDGQPLVADFGIALAVTNAGGARITQTGISVGTPQYMSPEQAAAERELDGRSDLYSLGAVLFEMLAGEPPFTGPNTPAVLAKLMQEPAPSVTARRRSVPASVAAAVSRCLEKIPADRYRTAAEFATALTAVGTPAPAEIPAPGPAPGAPARPSWRERALLPLLAITAAAGAIAIRNGLALRAGRGAAPPVAFTVELPDGYRLVEGDPAVSPDGRIVVFVADSGGVTRLLFRDLAEPATRVIPGTEDASADPAPPFFSPDGRWVAFIAGRKVRKVQVAGGAPSVVDVADFGGIETVHGGTWSDDGWILLGAGLSRGLVRVRETGGTLETFAEPDRGRGENSYLRPAALPAGRGVLFVLRTLEGFSIAHFPAAAPDTPRVLIPGGTAAEFVPPDHLLFSRGDGLFASPFDPASLELGGSAVLHFSRLPLEDWGGGRYADFAVAGGTLALVTQAPGETRSVERWTERLVLLDRNGGSTALGEGTGDYVRASPRGDVLATYDSVQITTWDLARGGLRNRLTADVSNVLPIFSRDGSRIVYTSYRSGAGDLYSMAAGDGSGQRLLLTSERRKYPESITPDGRILLFREYDPVTVDDIWMLPLEDGSTPVPLIRTEFRDYHSAISPDGTLVAYTSNRSGRPEVWVQDFPESAGAERVSTSGGEEARWRPDGAALYYLEAGRIMEVEVRRDAGRLRIGTPRAILPVRVTDFDVMPDGQRFAAMLPAETPPRRFLGVYVNWRPDR